MSLLSLGSVHFFGQFFLLYVLCGPLRYLSVLWGSAVNVNRRAPENAEITQRRNQMSESFHVQVNIAENLIMTLYKIKSESSLVI